MRPTIHDMITQDLGYCCEFWFFSYYRQTSLIAARLGVSPRAVRYHKADNKACGLCQKKEGCLMISLGAPNRR